MEQYKCKSYVDDNGKVQDCTCGICGYQVNVSRWKKAYTDILRVCEKYPNFDHTYGYNDIREMKNNAKNHLTLIEWYEKYGLKIDHDHKPYTYNYFRVNDYLSFNQFGDAEADKDTGSGRFISWSDDDRQPKNEWLMCISFATGAYIFGQDYDSQKSLFQDFFNELKSYKPDYSDSHNSCLYWKLENAKAMYEEFNKILNKYHKRNQSELKKREADKLERQLEKLKEELREAN